MNIVLIIFIIPILLLLTIWLLLEGWGSNWWDPVPRRPTVAPFNYGRKNTNWLAPDTTKHKEIEVNGVPVLYYKKVDEGYQEVITTTVDCPQHIKWNGDKFSWIWITSCKRMGWRQDNPPAAPTIICSDDMMTHVDRILLAEFGTKPANKEPEDPLKWAKNGTKQP